MNNKNIARLILSCLLIITFSKSTTAQEIIEKGVFKSVEYKTENNSGMDLRTDIHWYKVKFSYNNNVIFKFSNPQLLAINWRGERNYNIEGVSELESVKGNSDQLPVDIEHASISGIGIEVELQYEKSVYKTKLSMTSTNCSDDPNKIEKCKGFSLNAVLPYELTQTNNYITKIKIKSIKIISLNWDDYFKAAALCR